MNEPETTPAPEVDTVNEQVNELLQRYTAAQTDEEGPDEDDLGGGSMLDEPEQPRSFAGINATPNQGNWRTLFAGNAGSSVPGPAKPEIDLPIWGAGIQDAHANARLKIQRQTAEGMWEELGFLPRDAGQYTLIGKFRAAGCYRIMPIDGFGQGLHPTGFLQNIPHDHPYLRQLQQTAQTAQGQPGGFGGMFGGMAQPGHLAEILSFVRENNGSVTEAYAKLDNDRSKVNHEAIAVVKSGAEESMRLNRDVLAVASEAEIKRAEMIQKMSDAALAAERAAAQRSADAERDIANRHRELTEQAAQANKALVEQAASQNQTFMSTFLQLQATSAERERQAMEARMAEDQRRRDEWMREQAATLERERLRIQSEAEERRARDERERAERREMAERDAKRQEEHNRHMLTLQMKVMEASNPLANLMAMGPLIAPVLGALGVDGKSLIEMAKDAMTGGAQKGITAEIMETVRTGIETFGKVMAAQAGGEEEEDPEDLGDGTVRPPQLEQSPYATLPPPPAPPVPVAEQAAAHPNIPPGMTAATPVAAAPAPAAPTLPPTVLKKARMAIMSLVEDLSTEADQSTWEMITMKHLGPAAKEVGQYLNMLGNGNVDAGIVKAALEADASPELAQAFLTATKSMTMIQAALR